MAAARCPLTARRNCVSRGDLISLRAMAISLPMAGARSTLIGWDHVTPEMMKPVVARYFNSIHESFQAYTQKHAGSGYKIGMYCTGAMCLLGDDSNLADFFWIGPEGRNDPSYRKFLQRERPWH